MKALRLKSEIKSLVEKQKFYKNQRKTVKIVGEKLLSNSEATWRASGTSQKLRLMYAAYGLLRGKTFSQIENAYSEENHPLKQFQVLIDKLVKEYEEVEVVCAD